MTNDYQLIITVINGGFSDEVMAHAKKAGARGGTVLHARGTGSNEIAQLFGITIQPEKELVLIISPASQKDAIMQAIAKGAGINTQSNGIVFSLLISNTLGLFVPPKKAENTETVKEELGLAENETVIESKEFSLEEIQTSTQIENENDESAED